MKEKINLLSKGIFEYESPKIWLSETGIDLKVEAGSTYDGSLHIKSKSEVPIRAMVFSSNKQMQCEENAIIGVDNVLNYHFDTGKLEPGTTVGGQFNIISNGGELEVPFKVTICAPFCSTSIGDIKDLFQFTNLASEHWEEAVKLFRSPDFARVFLVNKQHIHLYQKLLRGKNVNQALEEFLYTLKKKRKIKISVSQKDIFYNHPQEAFMDKLVIEKDNWGYQEIFVSVEGEFIRIPKTVITTGEFQGSYYELEYFIDPAYFSKGRNDGKIIIENLNYKVEILVTCMNEKENPNDQERMYVKKSINEMMQDYIDLQLGKLDREKWIRKTRELIDGCRNKSNDVLYALYEAHFLTETGNYEGAKEIMAVFSGRDLRKKSVLLYCYYLFVTCLYRQEVDYTHFVIQKLQEYYQGECDRFEVLWMLMRIDQRMAENPQGCFKLLKQQFEWGCASPLMYLEAIRLSETDPSVLREFGMFEISLLHWGTTHKCLDQTVVYWMSEIAVRGKLFNELALASFIQLCKKYNYQKDILMAVCSLLIKGHKTDTVYNDFYKRGIEDELKLTDLYEHYMMSLDEHKVRVLPHAVLYYFNYNNKLSSIKKAFLYKYIIQHKESLERVYNSYENIMKAFTFEQLRLGRINENIVVLYKHFISKDKINEKIAHELPEVMFKYQVNCMHPRIKGIIVTHKEVNKEVFYPLNDGKAFINIFMDDYNVALVDFDGNRYISSVTYTIEKLMDEAPFMRECYEYNRTNPMILMNRSERALKYQMIDDASINIYKETLKLKDINEEYQKNILKNLIDIYYENYEGETLEKYLLQLDITLLGSKERSVIIEYYIQRGFYEKAYKAISIYGYDGIKDKRIMRLCSWMIRKMDYEEDSYLVELSYYAYHCGKFDEVVLEYLIKYYLGTTKVLLHIWHSAINFEVNAFELEERIICQVLFSESTVEEIALVFGSYYKMHPNDKVIRAFLAYGAYKYLVKEKDIHEKIFHYMEIELDQMERARDICALALIKQFAGKKETMEEGYTLSWINKEIERFMIKGIVLPFFAAFAGLIQVPSELIDKTFIKYITNPKDDVKLHYCISLKDHVCEKEDYVTEEMNNAFAGIFIKTLNLYEDEKLQYYITIQTSNEEAVATDIITITPDIGDKDEKGKCRDWINLMLNEIEFNDFNALDKTMQTFEEKKYVCQNLFQII